MRSASMDFYLLVTFSNLWIHIKFINTQKKYSYSSFIEIEQRLSKSFNKNSNLENVLTVFEKMTKNTYNTYLVAFNYSKNSIDWKFLLIIL